MQQLRTEGSITLFINKLSKIFFSNINETADEFQHAFGEISGCFSGIKIPELFAVLSIAKYVVHDIVS